MITTGGHFDRSILVKRASISPLLNNLQTERFPTVRVYYKKAFTECFPVTLLGTQEGVALQVRVKHSDGTRIFAHVDLTVVEAEELIQNLQAAKGMAFGK